jgi:hypothetical protein
MFVELNNQKNYNPSLPNSYTNCQYYNESHIDPKLLHPIPAPIFFNLSDSPDSTLSLGNTTSTDATTTTSTTTTDTSSSSSSSSSFIPLIIVGVLVLGLFAIKK